MQCMCVRTIQVRTKNNGAIQKGVLSCFISKCACYMNEEWLYHLGFRLRQRSFYCARWLTVYFSSTHFPGFCLGRVFHRRYKKVWTNMKNRCGFQQNCILLLKFQRKITCTYYHKSGQDVNF